MPDGSTSVLFVVNELHQVSAGQTTAALLRATASLLRSDAVERGDATVPGHVWVTTPRGFGRTPDGVVADAWPVAPATDDEALLAQLRSSGRPRRVAQAQLDAVWVRTNPGRDPREHRPMYELLHQAADAGVVVRNSPVGLQRAATKRYLGSLPAHTVPPTWIDADPARLRDALATIGRGVLKPPSGTRGQDVRQVHIDDPDLDDVLARATVGGDAVLQAFVPEAPAGDLRVHVVDGELLRSGGADAVVRRVPASGEWRSNVALGGIATAASADATVQALVDAVGPTLRDHGLWHVGLDIVGDRIVECNVFSPGGLGDIEAFTGCDFVHPLVQRFVAGLSPASER